MKLKLFERIYRTIELQEKFETTAVISIINKVYEIPERWAA